MPTGGRMVQLADATDVTVTLLKDGVTWELVFRWDGPRVTVHGLTAL
jgi:hypothetical protein